ncbi:MAG: hypothetical protein IJK00_05095 [Clostridia bacterium]|nr:hypothetical protein [Clostridia bacterium]MBR3564289.1 hypothetical protein [Clostridia bacterium]
MGLFSRKDKKTYKLADFFSPEEVGKIRSTIEPKLSSGQYGAMPQLMGKGLLDYLKDPIKELSEGRMNSFVKIADAVKTFEPELAPILQNGINRFRG